MICVIDVLVITHRQTKHESGFNQHSNARMDTDYTDMSQVNLTPEEALILFSVMVADRIV